MAYRPSSAPVISSVEDLRRYVQQEFDKIASDTLDLDLVTLSETTAAPTKPRKGNIRYADGTLWNPGAGAGFYGFNGSTWNKF